MAVGLMLALLVVSPIANAQSPESGADERARELFLKGNAHYAAGRYEEAVAHFLAAYDLCGKATLLYNLANVYERLSDYTAAADSLRRYLETPEVHDVVSVRERLRRLELAAASRPPPVVSPPVVSAPPPAVVPPARAASNWPGWVLGAATAGAAASTVTFGLLTEQVRDELKSRCDDVQGRTLCRDTASPFLDRERQRALATDISIGATAVLGTATLAYIVTKATGSSTSGEARGGGPADWRRRDGLAFAVLPSVSSVGGGVQLVVTGRR